MWLKPRARHSGGIAGSELLRLDEIVVGDEEPVVEREQPPGAEASDALSVQDADRGFTHHNRLLGPMERWWKRPAAGDEERGRDDEHAELANAWHGGSVREMRSAPVGPFALPDRAIR